MPQVIASRIRACLDAGGLPEVIKQQFKPIHKVGDLLLDWDELFPGESEAETYRAAPNLRRLRVAPIRKRSVKPLPPPRSIDASPATISRELFDSVRAVWTYYQEENKAKPQLLDEPFTCEGVVAFLDQLYGDLSKVCNADYLHSGLEGCDSMNAVGALTIMLPVTSYDEEHAGIEEAFLSGPDDIASLMNLMDEDGWEIEPEDQELIKNIGWPKLLKAYDDYTGEGKTVDTQRLSNAYEHFFKPVEDSFPGYESRNFPLISGDYSDAEVVIEIATDIRFFIAWCNAYHELMGLMPDPYYFYANESNERDKFAANVCHVWRLAKEKS